MSWTVTRDGQDVSPTFATGSEAFGWLLRHQPASVEHATRHEGYGFRESGTYAVTTDPEGPMLDRAGFDSAASATAYALELIASGRRRAEVSCRAEDGTWRQVATHTPWA